MATEFVIVKANVDTLEPLGALVNAHGFNETFDSWPEATAFLDGLATSDPESESGTGLMGPYWLINQTIYTVVSIADDMSQALAFGAESENR